MYLPAARHCRAAAWSAYRPTSRSRSCRLRRGTAGATAREKAGDYATFGVRWYWLIDPERRSLDILALDDGRYEQVVTASTGLLGDVPGCEGLVLPLDELWTEVDRLADIEPDDEAP